MNGYSPKYIQMAESIVGGSTSVPISDKFNISADGAIHLLIAVKISNSSVLDTITFELWTGIKDQFVISKTGATTTDGVTYIKLLAERAADQTYLPLGAVGEIRATSGADDTADIDWIAVLQNL